MIVTVGSTDVTTYVHLRLAADGTDATGLTITDIDLQYVRSGVAPAAKVDATALAATDSAHADNKAIEVDGTDQPGVYRVDWPDAAFAAGVREVILTVKCALVFTESLRVTLISATRGLAGTALPDAAAEASGGLPTLSAAQASNGTIQANVHRWLTGTPNALQSGRVDSYLGAVATGVIDAASFAAGALDAVWSTATRLLTAGTNIVLAKGTGVTGFNDLSAANVNAEVVDALNVDTYAEPGQEAPPATTTLAKKLGYLYKLARNKIEQTATELKVYADDGTTVDQKATVSDDATTYTRSELETGP